MRRVRRPQGGLAGEREGVLLRIGPLLAALELQMRRQFLERYTAIGVPGLKFTEWSGVIPE